MNLQSYSQQALLTDTFAPADEFDVFDAGFLEKLLGLVGESGEIAEKVKKIIRDQDGKVSDEQRLELMKELGDVLWYVNALAVRLGYSLDEVAQANIDKLASRKKRNLISGSGDNR
ncbi:hypothetical protein EOL96_08745 [Candidatus Saccharibacteria bacterium]|nr:hypothetical protein [Candidatus Saccharibacteria bacterium]